MAKKKVQAVSFEDLKALVVNEAKQNGNVLTQEQIDEYLMNYDCRRIIRTYPKK